MIIELYLVCVGLVSICFMISALTEKRNSQKINKLKGLGISVKKIKNFPNSCLIGKHIVGINEIDEIISTMEIIQNVNNMNGNHLIINEHIKLNILKHLPYYNFVHQSKNIIRP